MILIPDILCITIRGVRNKQDQGKKDFIAVLGTPGLYPHHCLKRWLDLTYDL